MSTEIGAHELLSQFYRILNTNRKQPACGSISPKLENIRVKIIRSFKKAIKEAHKNMIPMKSTHIHCLLDSEWFQTWSDFSHLVNESSDILSTVFSNSPTTDGKKSSNSIFRSYSNDYVEYFLSVNEVYNIYQAYLKVIFYSKDFDHLSNTFQIRCCREEQHSESCDHKWSLFREFLVKKMRSKHILRVNS